MALFSVYLDETGVSFHAVQPSHIRQWLAHQLEAHSRQTAMNRLLSVRSYYRSNGHGDPTAGIPIKRDRLLPRQPYSAHELSDLYRACETLRQRAIVSFLIGSGCRRMEVCQLQAEHIDWKRECVKIRGKGAKERWVSPGAAAMADLRTYLGDQGSGLAFGLRSGHNLYQIIRRIGKRAGVVNANVHRFRVTFAVQFRQHYGDLAALQCILGHERLSTTERYASYGVAEDALRMQRGLDLAAIAREAWGRAERALDCQREIALGDRL